MPKELHNLVGVLLLPQAVDDFNEVPADQVRDIAKDWLCDSVDLLDAHVRIHQVHAERRLIEQGLVLCRAIEQRLIRSVVEAVHLQMPPDTRNQARRPGFHRPQWRL